MQRESETIGIGLWKVMGQQAHGLAGGGVKRMCVRASRMTQAMHKYWIPC